MPGPENVDAPLESEDDFGVCEFLAANAEAASSRVAQAAGDDSDEVHGSKGPSLASQPTQRAAAAAAARGSRGKGAGPGQRRQGQLTQRLAQAKNSTGRLAGPRGPACVVRGRRG